jgi:predicted AAA+ superfamily ATPase
MEKLIAYQVRLMDQVNDHFFRFLYHSLPWQERCIGIKGPRGSGKTTMLLQYARYQLQDPARHLYVTMDHPYFYDRDLLELADDFYQLGGQTLLIDEIHKYPNWSRAIKHLYDGYPGLRIIFTSSSALDLYRGEADLSRRVVAFELPGLSFREYLALEHDFHFPVCTLDDILTRHLEISRTVVEKIRPIAFFQPYLQNGYFPFFIERDRKIYQQQVFQAIETTLLQDISFIEGFSVDNVQKMQRLLAVLVETAPFEPNLTKLAERLQLGRDTVKKYIFLLGKARILNLLSRQGKGISTLQKPDKIYLENTNYSYALKDHPDSGNLRETFFLNQLRNAGHSLFFPGKQVDFATAEGTLFEIGGKNKEQPLDKDVYVVKDGIATGFGKTIPLWLFGFLY